MDGGMAPLDAAMWTILIVAGCFALGWVASKVWKGK